MLRLTASHILNSPPPPRLRRDSLRLTSPFASSILRLAEPKLEERRLVGREGLEPPTKAL